MNTPRQIRRLAMQLLYQIDMRGPDDLPAIEDAARDSVDDPAVAAAAYNLAVAAWEVHTQADAAVAPLAPDWPAHRQPPVDRAILRLAWCELHTEHAPPRVVINEAVELAKEFCEARSAKFINAVLDKIVNPPPPAPDDAAVQAADESSDAAALPPTDAADPSDATDLSDAADAGNPSDRTDPTDSTDPGAPIDRPSTQPPTSTQAAAFPTHSPTPRTD